MLYLVHFLLKLLLRAALFLGSIRGKLHAIQRKHLPPDQSRFVAHQQHVAKQLLDRSVPRSSEIGDRGEVRRAVRGQRHEDHVLATQLANAAAGTI
jgi:hypothetical protein